jgi:hypothetical protein
LHQFKLDVDRYEKRDLEVLDSAENGKLGVDAAERLQ